MGYTMGCPCKKLNNLPSGGGRKGAANAKAFILEPFKERNCIDDDFDPTKTADNIYYGADGKECDPIAGMDILKGWKSNAENHKGKSKDGKMTRGCRKDAVIGGMTIIKPSLAFMDSLGSDDARNLFMERVVKYVYEEFAKNNGVVIDAVVVHMDEENPHPHIAYHDPDMSLGKKIGLKMFQELNVDFPNYMRDTYGYDLDPCRRFDPDVAAQMTDEELVEYKAQIKKDKKKAGKDSNKYKADREIQKAKEEAEKILADAKAEKLQLTNQITELKAEIDDLKAEQERMLAENAGIRNQINQAEAVRQGTIAIDVSLLQ